MRINGPVIAESTVVYEKNVGASVDIQDIAVISSSRAYVTQLYSAQIAVVDPQTGVKTGASIDLSAFDTYAHTDSADAYPYMSRELYYNGKVYIACQRLKAPAGGYIQAADTSKIVVVDAATDSVVKSTRAVDLQREVVCGRCGHLDSQRRRDRSHRPRDWFEPRLGRFGIRLRRRYILNHRDKRRKRICGDFDAHVHH